MIKSFSFNSISKELNSRKLFIISICSMLGIGIFLKSKTLIELSKGEYWPIFALFCISTCLIISMCWAFTRLVDKNTSSGRGFVEWVEKYCGTKFKNWVVGFTTKLLHPIGILTTSIYLIKWVNEKGILGIWGICICAFLLSAVITSLNVFSFKGAVILQKVLSCFIFLSILYTLGFGIHSFFARSGQGQSNGNQQEGAGLNKFGSWTVLMSGLPSIFFMYDGFYSVLSLKERTRKETSFRKIVSLSFIAITLIYFLVISVTLMADKKTGDFMNFQGLKTPHFKNILTVLIFLTFLSSLNVSSMCGQNQLVQLHYKYNFKEINSIRERFIKVKSVKYGLASKLSVWIHLLGQMGGIALVAVFITQIMYWTQSHNIEFLWTINDTLAELNSLIIFGVLGIVLWNSRAGKKTNLFTSIGILIAFIYFLLNNVISLFYSGSSASGKNPSHFTTALLKLLILGTLITYPVLPQIKFKLKEWFAPKATESKRFNKLNQEYSLVKIVST
ncbi:amino acid permease [Mycoplasma wenyonii]|uniref:Amino acid permease n=1 Tax=Mycoplasma wenyonii TaxID=65123 RepID=A0A328PRI8_9MOLU|nr:amino acid permease [Mycoplasma wenyonii]RAO94927.1 amino acid permease [Mycoplasma wenyonii]